MNPISQPLLNFLLNAFWQIALVAATASLCAWLLRKAAARYRNFLWAAALIIALGLPLLTSVRLLGSKILPASAAVQLPALPAGDRALLRERRTSEIPAPLSGPKPFLTIKGNLAGGLAALYLLFLLYRSGKLLAAWRRTRSIKASSHPSELNQQIQSIIDRCQTAIGVSRFSVLSSTTLSVPITVGIHHPLVILPEKLLHEGETDVLISALGHELVHVWRRDYLLNLLYELIFLPISFHPAAALLRRRINQTRELSCDELVAEKLLTAETYARSLVQLAGSAVPFSPPATLTVGITDADILEVRIMSLLRKSKFNLKRKRLLLVAAALLLAVPCVAAASFGLRFDIKPDSSSDSAQELGYTEARQENAKAKVIYKTEPEYTEDARANHIEGSVVLSLIIDANGRPQDIQVTKPLYPSLDQSAIETISRWRFEPNLKDGQPTAKRVSVEMVFSMHSGEFDPERAAQDRRKQQEREEMELKQRIERETNGEVRAKLEAELVQIREARNIAEPSKTAVAFNGEGYELRLREGQEEKEMKERAERDPQFRAELEARARHQEEEQETMSRRNAALTGLAKIPMDQAIQIALGQQPGKVLECSLVGEHWEGEGQLAKASLVLYHVVIIPAEGTATATVTGRDSQTYLVNLGAVHVLINANDGSVFRTSKERVRDPRKEQP